VVTRRGGAASRRRVASRASFFDAVTKLDPKKALDGVVGRRPESSADDDSVRGVEDVEDGADARASVDASEARSGFAAAAAAALDKIADARDALASQTVDLDEVEVVEDDVVSKPMIGGFVMPRFGKREGQVEEAPAKTSRGATELKAKAAEPAKPKFSFRSEKKSVEAPAKPSKSSPVKKTKKAVKEEEEEVAPASGFGAILQKSAKRLDTTRAILDQDLEEGVAAQGRLRASREGGKAISAFTGAQVGEGSWTLTQIMSEDSGARGKKLSPLKIKRGESKIIGRSKAPGVDLVVPLPCVSSVHAELITEGNKLFIQDLGSTNGTYVEGFEVRKDRKFRIFNGAEIRLGAENFNGEQYALFKATLEGAKELEKDSEYGQLNYFMEFLGGPRTVVNFFFINFVFQLTFFILIKLNSD